MENAMRKNRDSVNENDFFSIILFLLFETVAVSLWFIKGDLFYLLNFSYIGCCLALGTTAKIFGPLFFGRGWCGYACWTTMVLDICRTSSRRSYERKNWGFCAMWCSLWRCRWWAACFLCRSHICPMNVEVNKESRKRKNGTECILCYECTKGYPARALHWDKTWSYLEKLY